MSNISTIEIDSITRKLRIECGPQEIPINVKLGNKEKVLNFRIDVIGLFQQDRIKYLATLGYDNSVIILALKDNYFEFVNDVDIENPLESIAFAVAYANNLPYHEDSSDKFVGKLIDNISNEF